MPLGGCQWLWEKFETTPTFPPGKQGPFSLSWPGSLASAPSHHPFPFPWEDTQTRLCVPQPHHPCYCSAPLPTNPLTPSAPTTSGAFTALSPGSSLPLAFTSPPPGMLCPDLHTTHLIQGSAQHHFPEKPLGSLCPLTQLQFSSQC